MAFSAYIVSAVTQNTASNILASESSFASGSNDDGIATASSSSSFFFSYSPTQTSGQSQNAGAFSDTLFGTNGLSGSNSGSSDTYAVVSLAKTAYTSSMSFTTQEDLGAYQNNLSGNSSLTVSASTTTTSDFPFATITFSSGSTENFYSSDGLNSTSTSSSNSESGTGLGAGWNSVLYGYSTFTYTNSYTLDYSTTAQQTSYVIFPAGTSYESESTTFQAVTKSSPTSTTETFTSVRISDFTFCTALNSVTITYGLEYFRNVGAKSSSLSQQPLLRAFWNELTTISSYSGIDKYDAILNESDSTQFTIGNFNIPVGSGVSGQSNSIYTLTTNTWDVVEQTTTLISYSVVPFEHDGKTYSFFANTGTFEYTYHSFSESSDSYELTIYRQISTIPTSDGYFLSAYSYYKTSTYQTTSTYKDFVCNSITFLEYTASRQITEVSSFLTATNTLRRSDSFRTEYLYNSFNFFTFISFAKTPSNFYSFSTQKILHGNFVRNVTDETAFWGVKTTNFAGIIDFSCLARRDSLFMASTLGIPRFYGFGNYSVVCPYDPLSTSISNITISQSVSLGGTGTATTQTLITQTLSWINTINSSLSSSIRNFELSYESQTQTMPWTSDGVNDFDIGYSTANLSPKPESATVMLPTPVAQISPECIFNTVGQMNLASYNADGAYFKSGTDSVVFVSTTYPDPISIELGGNADNSLAGLNIAKNPVGDTIFLGNPIVSFYMPMRAFFQ